MRIGKHRLSDLLTTAGGDERDPTQAMAEVVAAGALAGAGLRLLSRTLTAAHGAATGVALDSRTDAMPLLVAAAVGTAAAVAVSRLVAALAPSS